MAILAQALPTTQQPRIIATGRKTPQATESPEQDVDVYGVRRRGKRWHWTRDRHEGYLTRWSSESFPSFVAAYNAAQRIAQATSSQLDPDLEAQFDQEMAYQAQLCADIDAVQGWE